ncbi:ribonuclease H-like domain-containing protein [Tanacetum coccineum]|uniref:Ribonuclease H-like domain-containing protein n=1 Tax=Tanacetum coccineum TaxID=301880 RepID=A0ABQ5FPT1_9ASTR
MYVHNFVHNTPHNSEHNSEDEAVPNNVVTLISKLDLSHPLHLHHNDSTTLTIVSIKLKGTENYNVWSCAMLLAFEGRNKIGFIDNTCRRSYTDEVLGRQWDRVNAVESHRAVVTGSGARPSQRAQSSVFNSSVNNRSGVQRSQTFGNTPRPNNASRHNNNGNKRTAGGPVLVCENYGYNGHTIDRCFKIIWYPSDFGKKNNANQNNQNFNKRFINNNNYVGSSFTSTSTFSDEQISTLISLIKENSLNNNGKGVQANMAGIIFNNNKFFNKKFNKFFNSNIGTRSALEQTGIIFDSGANQHLTYTDKSLVNVIDISCLRIKVSHLNGTEALITKLGNLILTKFLTLYDVLVVPEYSVTLVSVHKDLMDVKLMGIDKQINGLYYFDSVEGFDKINNDNIPCHICQKPKETREPFPLSEHKFTVLGELVHLDLWGPYRVVSKEGHRLPSSVLKGKCSYELGGGDGDVVTRMVVMMVAHRDDDGGCDSGDGGGFRWGVASVGMIRVMMLVDLWWGVAWDGVEVAEKRQVAGKWPKKW